MEIHFSADNVFKLTNILKKVMNQLSITLTLCDQEIYVELL